MTSTQHQHFSGDGRPCRKSMGNATGAESLSLSALNTEIPALSSFSCPWSGPYIWRCMSLSLPCQIFLFLASRRSKDGTTSASCVELSAPADCYRSILPRCTPMSGIRFSRESSCCVAVGRPSWVQSVNSVKGDPAKNSIMPMLAQKSSRMLLQGCYNTLRITLRCLELLLLLPPAAMEESLAAAAMHEVFGPVLGKRLLDTKEETAEDRPTKAGKPGQPKGKGKGKGKKKANNRFSGSASGSSEEQDWYAEAIMLLGRMMVRQEDVLHVIRQSTGWVWWMRVSAPTLVPDLFQAAQVWKKEITNPQSPMAGTSLRSSLLWCILHKLTLTLQSEEQALLEMAVQNGWYTKEQTWVYQVWSPAQKQLQVDTSRKPLTTNDVLQLLTDMKKLVSGDTVSRFHATRPLTDQMSGQVLTMVMDISFRKAESNELYDLLERLQGLAALQLCGVQYRREGFKRSPAAQRLLELLG